MVLIAPDGALHVSDMLTLQPQTVLSLIASERRNARSAINTIQAVRHSVVDEDALALQASRRDATALQPHHRLHRYGAVHQPDAGGGGVAVDTGVGQGGA